MNIELFFQYLVAGLTYGTIYAITGIGFNIIYNTTGIINFAQGEFLMLGGMSAITFSNYMPLPAAVILAVILTAIIGGIIDLLIIRNLKKQSILFMVIVTIGLSILLQEAALHIWDEKVRSLKNFTGDETTSINILGAYITPQVL